MKHGFTLEQHKVIARTLFAIKELLMSILVSVSQAYPLPVSSRINKAIDNIDRTISELDDRIFQESKRQGAPNDPKIGYIYYPGQEGHTQGLGDYFKIKQVIEEILKTNRIRDHKLAVKAKTRAK